MTLEKYFERLHNNPLPPLNPEFNPNSVDWFREVAHSMEIDGLYDKQSREECSIEFRRRYEILKAGGTL
jgi:hypothetical protein